jgi:predicted adenylyl cyclase CyaB
MPRVVELKSVVEDVDGCRRRIETAGARVVFEGRLEDRRYDTADRRLTSADQVLRVRRYADRAGARASLEWKGPTRQEDGYKVRDEIGATTSDAAALGAILERLGYVVVGEIDRDVAQYALDSAVIRFERYPRMDPLVEVEGAPDAIERAIEALGIPRERFSAERLLAFVARFEERTGTHAAVNDRQLADGRRSRDGSPDETYG